MLGALASGAAAVEACSSFGVTNDTATDAGAETDSATTRDGGLDAEMGGDSFCAAHLAATDCTDFDDVDASLGGWASEITDGGTLVPDPALAYSPPRSLRSTVVNTTVTAGRLRRHISHAAKEVRLSFVFRRDGDVVLGGGQQLSIAEFFCRGMVDEGVFIFLENQTFDVIADQVVGSAEMMVPLPSIEPNTWTPIVLDAHLDLTPPTVDVKIGRALPQSVQLSPTCLTDPSVDMVVGLSTYSTGVSGKAYYDNVLYEEDPTP